MPARNPTGVEDDENAPLEQAFEDDEDSEWGPDESPLQYGAAFEDLTPEDQRLIAAADVEQPVETYDDKAPTTLPQPDRAKSVQGLPKVTSRSFPRVLK
jgi:hypothetical protein